METVEQDSKPGLDNDVYTAKQESDLPNWKPAELSQKLLSPGLVLLCCPVPRRASC